MVMRADSKWSGALVRDGANGGICLSFVYKHAIFLYFPIVVFVQLNEWVDGRSVRLFQYNALLI